MNRAAHLRSVARMLARTRVFRVAVGVPGLLALLMACGAMAYLSTTDSSEQEATAAMGTATWTLQGVQSLPPGAAAVPGVADAVREAGGTEVSTALISSEVTIDGLDPRTYLRDRPSYVEPDSGLAPFGTQFDLLSGRWPVSAGEVVISERLTPTVSDSDRLSVFAGAATWRVVGVLRYRLDYDSQTVVAGPGTWAAIADRSGLVTVAARQQAYWTGGDAEAIVAAVARTPGLEVGVDDLRSTLENRDGYFYGDPADRLTELSVFGSLPMVSALLAATLVAGLAVTTWATKVARSLWRIGARPSLLTTGARLALGAGLLSATAAGLVLGVLVGLALRPLWHLVRRADLPSITVPWAFLAMMMAAAAAGILLLEARVGLGRLRRPRWAQPHHLAIVTVAGGLALVLLMMGGASNDEFRAACVVLGAAVAVAGVVALLGARLLRSGSRTDLRTLAARRFQALEARGLILAVVTVIIGLGLGLATLFNTAVLNQAADRVADLPPGTALLGNAEGTPAGLRPAFESATGLSDPITITTLDVTSDEVGVLWAMSSADLERLLGHPLDAVQRSTFGGGGALTPEPRSALLVAAPDGRQEARLTATPVELAREIARRVAGIISVDTATAQGWAGGSELLYLDLTEQQLAVALDYRYSGAIDLAYLTVHVPVPPPTPPYGLFLVAMVVSLLTSTLVLGAFAGHTALGMRSLAAGLLALGAPRRAVARILLYQCGFVAALALVSGAAVSVLAVGAIVVATPGSALHVPWVIYGLTAVSLAVSVVVATALGNRRLHQTERLVTI